MSEINDKNPRGAGRNKIHPLLKKEPVSLKLPKWLIEKLANEEQSNAILIEQALCKMLDWTKPEV